MSNCQHPFSPCSEPCTSIVIHIDEMNARHAEAPQRLNMWTAIGVYGVLICAGILLAGIIATKTHEGWGRVIIANKEQ